MSDAVTIIEEKTKSFSPSIDFSYQLNIGREKVEKKIFAYLCDISLRLYKSGKKTGTLIVLGCFDSEANVFGLRQLGNKKVEKYINVAFGQFETEIVKLFESGDDGAIIVNQNGQILGTETYLMVDNPSLDIPEGAGTRHISAASFSTREDVLSTFTLSEETLAVRMWKDGHFVEQYRPDEEVAE
jgi:DNA integrity scanning protein DisA with diadenylate cyclase activity